MEKQMIIHCRWDWKMPQLPWKIAGQVLSKLKILTTWLSNNPPGHILKRTESKSTNCLYVNVQEWPYSKQPQSRNNKGFVSGSGVKNPPASAGEAGSIPGSGRAPGEGNSNPLQYSCLGNPLHRARQGTVHGVAKRVGHDLVIKQQTTEISIDIWINKIWNIYTMDYYSAIKYQNILHGYTLKTLC